MRPRPIGHVQGLTKTVRYFVRYGAAGPSGLAIDSMDASRSVHGKRTQAGHSTAAAAGYLLGSALCLGVAVSCFCATISTISSVLIFVSPMFGCSGRHTLQWKSISKSGLSALVTQEFAERRAIPPQCNWTIHPWPCGAGGFNVVQVRAGGPVAAAGHEVG